MDGSNCGNSGIFVSKLSDHFPIFTCQDIFKSNKIRNKFITVQEKSDEAIKNFVQFIHTSINDTTFHSDLALDPNDNYDKLEHILITGSNKYFPHKRKRFNKYKDKLNPWMTIGIMRSIKFKD